MIVINGFINKNFIFSFFLFIFSIIFSIFIILIACEGYFYINKGDFFFKKSVHYIYQQPQRGDAIDTKIAKKKLIGNYEIANEKNQIIADNQKIEHNIKFLVKDNLNIENSLIVFSSWIKSNEQNKVSLNIVRDDILFQSPFHSGNNTWEFLSVSIPLHYSVQNGGIVQSNINPSQYTKNLKTVISSQGTNFQYYKVPTIIRPLRNVDKKRPSYKYDVKYSKGDKIRVAIIGGSTTFNIYITPREGQDYPFLIQQMFDALYPGKVDVINYGMPAASTFSFLSIAQELVYQKTDIIAIVPPYNDSGTYLAENYYYDHALFSPLQIKYMEKSFFNKIAIGYFLKKAMLRLNALTVNKRRGEISEILSQDLKKGYLILTDQTKTLSFFYKGFYDRLKLLINYFKENEIEVMLSNLPYFRYNNEPFNSKLDHISEHKTLEMHVNYNDILNAMDYEVIPRVAKEENIQFIDLQKNSAFNFIDYSKRLKYFHDTIHFTPDGTRIIAYEMFKTLNKIVASKLNEGLTKPVNYIDINNNEIINQNHKYKLKNGNFENDKKFMGSLNNWSYNFLKNNDESEKIQKNNTFNAEKYGNWRRDNSHRATSTNGKGKIISDKFKITSDYLFFMMSGKKVTEHFTGVKIYADEKLIHSIIPTKNCEKEICDFVVNLKKWRGKIGTIEIIDGSNESFVSADNFLLN